MRALLFSGGLDSSALAWAFRPDVCLTVNYGQLAAAGEEAAAVSLCSEMSLSHEIVRVDLSALGSGAMAGMPSVSEARAAEFWPYRNQFLLTLAAMKLLPRGLKTLMIGAVASDRHVDGSAVFINAISDLMEMQEGAVKVIAPAVSANPVDLLRSSGFPHSLVGLTFSCHLHGYACGQCAGCLKHREIVAEVFEQI